MKPGFPIITARRASGRSGKPSPRAHGSVGNAAAMLKPTAAAARNAMPIRPTRERVCGTRPEQARTADPERVENARHHPAMRPYRVLADHAPGGIELGAQDVHHHEQADAKEATRVGKACENPRHCVTAFSTRLASPMLRQIRYSKLHPTCQSAASAPMSRRRDQQPPSRGAASSGSHHALRPPRDHAATIAEIAKTARVSSSTIYALFKSKEGILEALMSGALFGDSYQKAVEDSLRVGPSGADRHDRRRRQSDLRERDRRTGAYSARLRFLACAPQAGARIRVDPPREQEERLVLLYAQSKARKGLALAEARHLLWMLSFATFTACSSTIAAGPPSRCERWLSPNARRGHRRSFARIVRVGAAVARIRQAASFLRMASTSWISAGLTR